MSLLCWNSPGRGWGESQELPPPGATFVAAAATQVGREVCSFLGRSPGVSWGALKDLCPPGFSPAGPRKHGLSSKPFMSVSICRCRFQGALESETDCPGGKRAATQESHSWAVPQGLGSLPGPPALTPVPTESSDRCFRRSTHNFQL